MKILMTLCFCILLRICFTQNELKKVHFASTWGEAIQSTTESYLSCKERAINQAKTNALRKAGVAENISSYSTFFQSEVNGQYTDIFKSDILNDINGYVIVNKVLEEKKELDEFNDLIIKVHLDLSVLQYETKKDMTFDAWVTGIEKSGYLSSDKVTFSIKPNQDMYIRIFDLVDDKVYPIYPNAAEQNQLFLKQKEYNFPTANSIDYQFKFEGNKESHNFVILFLKEDIPYTSTSTDGKDLMDWMFQIPPHQRLIKTYSFEVFKVK